MNTLKKYILLITCISVCSAFASDDDDAMDIEEINQEVSLNRESLQNQYNHCLARCMDNINNPIELQRILPDLLATRINLYNAQIAEAPSLRVLRIMALREMLQDLERLINQLHQRSNSVIASLLWYLSYLMEYSDIPPCHSLRSIFELLFKSHTGSLAHICDNIDNASDIQQTLIDLLQALHIVHKINVQEMNEFLDTQWSTYITSITRGKPIEVYTDAYDSIYGKDENAIEARLYIIYVQLSEFKEARRVLWNLLDVAQEPYWVRYCQGIIEMMKTGIVTCDHLMDIVYARNITDFSRYTANGLLSYLITHLGLTADDSQSHTACLQLIAEAIRQYPHLAEPFYQSLIAELPNGFLPTHLAFLARKLPASTASIFLQQIFQLLIDLINEDIFKETYLQKVICTIFSDEKSDPFAVMSILDKLHPKNKTILDNLDNWMKKNRDKLIIKSAKWQKQLDKYERQLDKCERQLDKIKSIHLHLERRIALLTSDERAKLEKLCQDSTILKGAPARCNPNQTKPSSQDEDPNGGGDKGPGKTKLGSRAPTITLNYNSETGSITTTTSKGSSQTGGKNAQLSTESYSLMEPKLANEIPDSALFWGEVGTVSGF